MDVDRVEEGLRLIFARGELAGLSVALFDAEEGLWSRAWGSRRFGSGAGRGGPAGESDLPMLPETRLRVASMSKPFTALGILKLATEGRLDLEADVSDWLGFSLCNPAWPDKPITASMLLSHTSSLRDGQVYNLPLGHSLRECFEEGSSYYEGGEHFARPGAEGPAGAELSPGFYLSYCNLGFGVLGTILEAVTGTRFDLWIRDEVLRPLGIQGSYNVNLLSEEGLAGLGVLYRGPWAAGPGLASWKAQIDDLGCRRPVLPCRADPGLGPGDLEAYRPGTNGTLFAPQGGLRASAPELARLGLLICGGGSLGGGRLFPRPAIDAMTDTVWSWREGGQAGGDAFIPAQVGRGLMRFGTGQRSGDYLVPGLPSPMWGHQGDAWGLRGALLVDLEEGRGLVYLISGTARDPDSSPGRFSPCSIWEEEVRTVLLEGLGYRAGPRDASSGAGRSSKS